jgi:hypothetical protein
VATLVSPFVSLVGGGEDDDDDALDVDVGVGVGVNDVDVAPIKDELVSSTPLSLLSLPSFAFFRCDDDDEDGGEETVDDGRRVGESFINRARFRVVIPNKSARQKT